MSASHIHSRYRTVPASLLLDTLGKSLSTIKDEDRATDADLGQVLGKSEDRAGAYRAGAGDMGVVSFLRGCREWDGRFANDVLSLVGMRLTPIADTSMDESQSLAALGELIAKKAVALADNKIDDAELEAMWPEIERVAGFIDQLRARRAKTIRLVHQQ
ncbi:hypothetical protein SPKIRA_08180 [Sphingomonas paucimobilis]|uniref:hypothetical protein n=1 Tax=Sphingomonas TaxID=13687 RepID=UPI00064BD0C6|nr:MULTISPECIES: hypothetical protein [Sphingomonas]MBQ1481317.1 hypothetical protein [Sphingomonas sp.]RSU58608.1 hypothetical protein BRX36_20305 [Sphingomonas sp. S-NIH.Pt1_0416]BCI69988.1 hypothetical protein SPKIRA_08180 [Sphingomonas paucimobilis]